MSEARVYTVGHSNHQWAALVALLRQYRIELVADVRSQPYSRHARQFNKDQLQAELVTAGIRYAFFGPQLGGRPDDPEFFDADGYVLYDRLAASRNFMDGLRRLTGDVARHRVALLCSEENPGECHRNLLVGRVLIARGFQLFHIRGDGRLQSQAELDRETGACDGGQQYLFEELKERPWKSTRSVMPKSERPSSSES
jgi:uncharacterized protein (DUF488 family)